MGRVKLAERRAPERDAGALTKGAAPVDDEGPCAERLWDPALADHTRASKNNEVYILKTPLAERLDDELISERIYGEAFALWRGEEAESTQGELLKLEALEDRAPDRACCADERELYSLSHFNPQPRRRLSELRAAPLQNSLIFTKRGYRFSLRLRQSLGGRGGVGVTYHSLRREDENTRGDI